MIDDEGRVPDYDFKAPDQSETKQSNEYELIDQGVKLKIDIDELQADIDMHAVGTSGKAEARLAQLQSQFQELLPRIAAFHEGDTNTVAENRILQKYKNDPDAQRKQEARERTYGVGQRQDFIKKWNRGLDEEARSNTSNQ